MSKTELFDCMSMFTTGFDDKKATECSCCKSRKRGSIMCFLGLCMGPSKELSTKCDRGLGINGVQVRLGGEPAARLGEYYYGGLAIRASEGNSIVAERVTVLLDAKE